MQGHSLLNHIQRSLERGDNRRICILDEERSILEIPVNLGDPAVLASMLKAPVLVAIKAFGTLTSECVVESRDGRERVIATGQAVPDTTS